LLPDPWLTATKNLHTDDVVEATVTKVMEFGILVDLGNGMKGLVHVSETPNRRTDGTELKTKIPDQSTQAENQPPAAAHRAQPAFWHADGPFV
jgi:polyribonucleotide nucleotidyltransferase